MANIDTYLEQIANGEYGRDVRDAIHDALEAINDSIPNSTSVSQEVISARTPGDQGLPPYDNLKQRLDTEAETLLDQAEQLATPGIRANIQITNATVGYSSLKDRLDTEYADLNRKVGRVIGRADAAATAAEEAVEVATQAKDTAVSKATEAANAANTAASKATEASNAASSASSNAQVATNRASQASTSASEAASSANEAVTAAQQAQQAAQRLVVDDTLTQQGQAADAKKVGDEITDLKGDLDENETIQKLLLDNIPDTTQSYTFTDGAVSSVTHTHGTSIIRTDKLTYGESTISETRTLNSGESITIITNLTTLETIITDVTKYELLYTITGFQKCIGYTRDDGTGYITDASESVACTYLGNYVLQVGDKIKLEDDSGLYNLRVGTNNVNASSDGKWAEYESAKHGLEYIIDSSHLSDCKVADVRKKDGSTITNSDLETISQIVKVYRKE